MTQQQSNKDWIDLVMDDYLYNSDCDSPYPQEAIEQSENDKLIKQARKLFRELIELHYPDYETKIRDLIERYTRRDKEEAMIESGEVLAHLQQLLDNINKYDN